jgi:hypothetical protein
MARKEMKGEVEAQSIREGLRGWKTAVNRSARPSARLRLQSVRRQVLKDESRRGFLAGVHRGGWEESISYEVNTFVASAQRYDKRRRRLQEAASHKSSV